jgi:hypothetical protein
MDDIMEKSLLVARMTRQSCQDHWVSFFKSDYDSRGVPLPELPLEDFSDLISDEACARNEEDPQPSGGPQTDIAQEEEPAHEIVGQEGEKDNQS